MKTFTNYAEKKAKQFLNLLQGYTKGIRFTAILILLLMGVSNTWAWNISVNTYFYYDNSTLNWTNSCIQLMVGHSSWSQGYEMTKISNTNLYYVKMPKWDGATQIAVFGTDNVWGGEGSSISSRKSWAPNSTSVLNLTANLSGSRLLTVNSSATLSNSSLSSHTALNTDQKAVVQSNASGSYKDDANAGSVSISTYNLSSATAAAASTGTTSASAARTASVSMTATAKTGYTFVGWYDSNGALLTTNVEYTYTCSGSTATYYARFKENTYSVTISAGEGGTVSPSGSKTIGQVTKTTVTATANDNYEFANWTATGGVVVANTTSAATTITATAAGTLTANFRSTATNSLTVVAGANIESVAGSEDPVTLGKTYDIKATPKTGYLFSTWTANPAENATFGSATTANTTVTVNNGSVTVTASATEIMSTLTTSNQYNAGNPSYAAPSATVSNIGIATTATVTATAADNGYTFTGWTLTNCTRTDGGAADAPSITVCSNGDGKAATVVANYEEDLATTKWYISGNGNGSGNDLTPGSPFTGWATNGIQMFKKSGHSTEEIYYCTITANTIASSDDHFPFKVYNATTSKYWGNNGYWVTKENNHPTLSSNSGDNMKFRPYLTGTYEFKLDATNASSPVLTVTWPVYNQLRISAANPADATNTGEFDMTGSGTYTVTRSLKANTTYTFKIVYNSEWYGANSGNLTRASASKTLSTSGGNLTIKTDVAGNYTFTFNSSTKALSVTYPTAYTVTYGVGTIEGTDKVTTDPTVSSGSLVLASTPITFSKGATKAGYTWKNWNSKADGTGANLGTEDTYVSSNRAAAITVYACYDLVGYTVTLDPQEGTGGTASVSAKLTNPMPEIELPTREAYDFGGYYDAKGGQGTQYYKPDGTSANNWDKTTDATLYAHWIPTEYNITYELNGGTNHASNPKTYNITQEITLQDPTYTGHIFKGWFDNADFTGDAILSISAGSTGAKTFYAKWEIGTYEITLDLQQGTGGTQTISATFGSEMPAIITPTREGYLFNGYYDQTEGKGIKYYDETGKNIKNWNKGSATLYAYWVSYENCIFFKNNLKWNNVYIYTFTDNAYWNDGTGVHPATNKLEQGQMTQLGKTDIYYYILTSSAGFKDIAFSDYDMRGYGFFNDHKAIYRSDRSDQMPLFIPQKDQTPTGDTYTTNKYYSSGIWMKYNSTESGYVFANNIDDHWNEDPLQTDAAGGYHFATEVSLSGNTTYKFKIKSIKEDWFRTNTAITSTKNTDIEFKAEVGGNDVQLTTTSPGTYIISIDVTDGKMIVSVEYPLQGGDYRLVYVESEVLGKAPYTKFHPAQSIRYQAEGEKIDTISFYINQATGKNPAILLQQCSIDGGATITWNDVAIQYINGNGGANPAIAQAPAKRAGELYIGTGNVSITKNGVYNFHLSQNNGVATMLEDTHPYVGNYYIRTDGADGGWRKYNTTPDNIMTHSQTALTHGGYDYYFCKWLQKGNSVKYVVANDYSYCVSDTLTTDDIVTNINGDLPANANVRFTWNSSTDSLSRAYLAGSGIISDRYLVLIGDANLKDTSGKNFNVSGLKANEVAFEDMGNWLYQLDVKANQNTLVKLTADYNKKTQYFKGSADDTEQLIKGSENYYTLRLIYDFKTNYLVSGLVGNQTITDNLDLEEVMIVRSHHEEAQTLKISGNGSVTANKAYGVMTFNKTTLNDNTKSQYERALYWVSFPFNVKLDEAFGFGNYGEHWIMEYYDGEARAKNGAWVDSDTYWKYITEPKGYTLEAGKGYVLCLDLDLLGNSAEFWNNENTEIALYFPSSEENPIVINNEATQRTTTVLDHICSIERDDRNIHDSNWNIIGVPAYTKIAGMTGGGVISYYRYDASKNEYDPAMTSGFNFNTMHAYMVQYAGTINWTEQATSIAALAARKSPTSKDQYTLRLALQQEDAQCDHTFIRLQEDNVTAEFDMNYDLCKIINRGANIYSMINDVEVAANVLPVEERVIPIGLDIHETGNYTFAMPDGTDGITAILIDYETGKETNLLLADYTTELREGTNNERFALRVRPNHVATEVETIIDGANGQIQKYIINGALYILNNSQLYDAQGRMVQQ